MSEVEEFTIEECLNDIYARGEFQHWDIAQRSYVSVRIGTEGDCVKIQKSDISLPEAIRKLHQVTIVHPVKSNGA